MKLFKKFIAVGLCLALTMASSMPVFAADSGNWSFAASPGYIEVPRTIVLDYSSIGYTAKVTSKSGDSSMNAVVIEGDAYSSNKVAEISEAGIAVNIAKPTCKRATVTFSVALKWQSGKTANNHGVIARR